MVPERGELREYVGVIWVGGDPGVHLRVSAESLDDARRQVVAQYGDGHTISLWNEDDAASPR